MGDAPVQINPAGLFLNKLIKLLITGVGATAIEAFAEAEVPFLAFPLVKQIFEYIVGQLAGKLSIAVQDGAITLVFNIQTESELHGVITELLNLQKAEASGDANAIKEATEKAAAAWGRVIHWDGIAPHQ